MNSQDYKNKLQNHICTVDFEKKDGTIRKMKCTLIPKVIQDNNLNPIGNGPVYTDQQVRCIDVEKMEWRSFRIDSVINFSIDE